jgi:hypothetical protein
MASATLSAHETELVGAWVEAANGVVGDETCARIEALIRDTLEHVADHPECGAWQSLFRDPADGRFWERTYPHGDSHGGGPPAIRCIDERAARETYAW